MISLLSYLDERCVGHISVKRFLNTADERSRLPHALLFAGPQSVGKRALAHALAAYFLTEQDKRSSASIGQTATLIRTGSHPDFHQLQPEQGKKEISVESVREFSSTLMLKPFMAQGRVGIIDDAHRLSTAAANALLMTLEEPPPQTMLLLITHAQHRLLQTIISRCQLLTFGYLSDHEITQVLQHLDRASSRSAEELQDLVGLSEGTLFAFADNVDRVDTSIAEQLLALKTMLLRATGSFAELTPARAAHLASALIRGDLAKDEDRPLLFAVLRYLARKRLLGANPEELSLWADQLLSCLNTERVILERNANPETHLTALLATLPSASSLSS